MALNQQDKATKFSSVEKYAKLIVFVQTKLIDYIWSCRIDPDLRTQFTSIDFISLITKSGFLLHAYIEHIAHFLTPCIVLNAAASTFVILLSSCLLLLECQNVLAIVPSSRATGL